MITAVFGLSMVEDPLVGGGWYWDTANALGLFCLALVYSLFFEPGRSDRQKIHQWISYMAIAALFGHIGLLLLDATVWHYLGFDAPFYMWAGLAALGGLCATVVLALPQSRRFWHHDHRRFTRWHQAISWLSLVAVLWHVVGSGFYVSWLESIGYALLALLLAWPRITRVAPSYSPTRLWAFCLAPILFVLLKGLP